MSDNTHTSPRPKIRIFNPHRLKANELEESFIARQELFQSILDDLGSGKPKSSPQHHLVIGQRGMGKTTLLRRLALELHREPHCQRLLPLNFPEEQYIEVDRLSKFWLNCLDATADALEYEGKNDVVTQIDEEVKRLSLMQVDETTYHEACREAFTAVWKQLGRRPVLCIDNFNLLLSRLRKEDYSLRGYFSAPGAPVLMAASTVYPEEMADYGAAFYDGFKPHYLHPLTLEEVRDVLIRLAQSIENPGLVDRIYRELPRLAALRDLTGGNPRTAVLLFELFAAGFSEDAFEDLDALLDLVTPLYQSRLEQLSELAQTIVGTLARNWSPMTKAEIVSQARLVDSSVPAQLGRLRDIGLVEETPLFQSKKTGYQIAERFFNIWYLMRFASRRQRASLACLTRFLEEFHTPAERSRSARELLGRDNLSHGNITYAMALAAALDAEPALARELEWKAQLELIQQMDGIRERIAAILDPDEIHPAIYSFAELKQCLEKVVPSDCQITGREFAELVLGSPSLVVGSPSMVPGGVGKATRYDRTSLAGKKLSSAEVVSLVDELQSEVSKLDKHFSVDAVDWLRARLSSGTLTSWRDADQLSSIIMLADDENALRIVRKFGHPDAKRKLADEAFDKLSSALNLRPLPTERTARWAIWGWDLREEFGRYEEAEQAYINAIDIYPKNTWLWNQLGNLRMYDLDHLQSAEQAYREAILRDPKNARPWNNLGNLHQYRLGSVSWAEHAYRAAIRLDPTFAAPWSNLGSLLLVHLGRSTEAEQAYREAIRLDQKYVAAWNNLGKLLERHASRPKEAEQAYREAIRFDPNYIPAWRNLGNLLLTNCRYEEAIEAIGRALEIDPEDDSIRHDLAFLLRDQCGQHTEARALLKGVWQHDELRDTQLLHEALFAAYKDDWTNAANALRTALSFINGRLPSDTRYYWFRSSAVLLHLGFGERLVELLQESGADVTLLPWFAAVQAHVLGDKRHLLNLPVEARPSAEQIFDQIERRRQQLPPVTKPSSDDNAGRPV